MTHREAPLCIRTESSPHESNQFDSMLRDRLIPELTAQGFTARIIENPNLEIPAATTPAMWFRARRIATVVTAALARVIAIRARIAKGRRHDRR